MNEVNEESHVKRVIMRDIYRLSNPPLALKAGTVYAQLQVDQIKRAFAEKRKCVPDALYWFIWRIMHDE